MPVVTSISTPGVENPSSGAVNESLGCADAPSTAPDITYLPTEVELDEDNHELQFRNITLQDTYLDPRAQQVPVRSSTSDTQYSDLQDTKFGYVDLFSPWFPSVRPQYHDAKGFRSWRIWHSKRHILLWTAFISSTLVLIANIVLVAVLGSKYGIVSRRGLIKLYEGDCRRVKMLGTGSHIAINILSTLLLGASNLCMQLLVAPTRHEVDVAHQKKIWLDIGIPSWKNITNIATGRKWLFFVLMLSSVPLHFIYNSAISISVPQYGYPTVVASEHFVRGTDRSIGNWTNIIHQDVAPEGYNTWPSIALWKNSMAFQEIRLQANNTLMYERLGGRECIERYSDVFSKRGNLVVVTEDLPGDEYHSVHQYIYWPAIYGGFSRYNPCQSGSDHYPQNLDCHNLSPNSPETYAQWKRYDRKVLYCLSKRLDDHCHLNYSPTIFIAVSCFSFVKCLCIFATIFLHKDPTMSTIGDAIASFLEFPDDSSAHMGLVTKAMFAKYNPSKWEDVNPTEWRPKPHRWNHMPSLRRWLITMTLCLVVIVVALACGIPGAIGSRKRLHSMTFAWQMRQPIGMPNSNAFSGYFLPRYGIKGFIANVMYANVWQVVISFLYLAYNALLTCMLVGDEWSRFGTHRKTLRVTHPRGIQRSSYFISMPYKYGIPLMIANTILHILISQSMFIISTITYLPNLVEDLDRSYTVTGYSTSGIMISTCVGAGTVLILIGISFIKISSNIPLVSTCSIAISAACHRPKEDSDAHLLPVSWGVVSSNTDVAIGCSLTTLKTVRSPVVGEKISGQSPACRTDWIETSLPWERKVLYFILKWWGKTVKRKKITEE